MPPQLGHPDSLWDNCIFGSVGKVVVNQIPVTFELPAMAFRRQNGGNLFCAGHLQRMMAMFGADPGLGLLGNFKNFYARTELIESQNMVAIPHRYMRYFIEGALLQYATF
jgi:hypothetical protein